jgi:hypothetical protein
VVKTKVMAASPSWVDAIRVDNDSGVTRLAKGMMSSSKIRA